MTDKNSAGHVAIFIPTFGDGGVEHMLVNLAAGLVGRGVRVDFLVKETHLPYLNQLPPEARLIDLGNDGDRRLLERFVRYLKADAPDIAMSAKGRDDRIMIRAKGRAKVPTRFFLRTGTHISARHVRRRRNRLRRLLNYLKVRRLYGGADGIICVSQGVADDLMRITGIAADRIQVIRNPVVTPKLEEMAKVDIDHPWFGEDIPVILGAGGLRLQKNFPMLLRAFARIRAQREARLMILGEGRQRHELKMQAKELGVSDDFDLPGFVANPYAHMARARLFVLSSHWEGSPNVLAEALAVGTQVVSTDCPSGPSEILDNGRYGTLVPVDDEDAMVEAIAHALDNPADPNFLRAAVSQYTTERSTEGYLRAFGLLRDAGGQ